MEDLGPEYEDIYYNYSDLVTAFDADPKCFLIAVNTWQLALLQASLKYAHWPSRWEGLGQTTFEVVHQRVEELEHCLMAGCDVEALTTAISEGFSQLHEDMDALANKTVVPDLTDIAADVVSVGTDMLQLYTAMYYVAVISGVAPALLPPPPLLP